MLRIWLASISSLVFVLLRSVNFFMPAPPVLSALGTQLSVFFLDSCCINDSGLGDDTGWGGTEWRKVTKSVSRVGRQAGNVRIDAW